MEHLIQRERIAPLWHELTPLLERHRAEVAPYPDWRLAPDRALYETIENAGNLRVFTLRIGTEPCAALVGYCILTVGRNPHYTDVLMAHQDVLYLIPECRRSGLGLTLLRRIETDLRAEGVHCIAQRTKARKDLNLGPLFARLGYTEMDQVWLKRLDAVSKDAVSTDKVQTDALHTKPVHTDTSNALTPASTPSPARPAGAEFRAIPTVPELFQPRQDARDFYPHDALRGD